MKEGASSVRGQLYQIYPKSSMFNTLFTSSKMTRMTRKVLKVNTLDYFIAGRTNSNTLLQKMENFCEGIHRLALRREVLPGFDILNILPRSCQALSRSSKILQKFCKIFKDLVKILQVLARSSKKSKIES